MGLVATMIFTGGTLLSKNAMLPGSMDVPFDRYDTGFMGKVIIKDLSGSTVYDMPKTDLKPIIFGVFSPTQMGDA
jgi:hypothetical protein